MSKYNLEGYTVKSNGDIYGKRGKLLKPNNVSGYNYVQLCHQGVRYPAGVHMLVAYKYLNYTITEGYTIDHIDNNPQNNDVSNLQIITKRENLSKDRVSDTGYTGVTRVTRKTGNDKYVSRINVNGAFTTLGTFETPEDASVSYQSAVYFVDNYSY